MKLTVLIKGIYFPIVEKHGLTGMPSIAEMLSVYLTEAVCIPLTNHRRRQSPHTHRCAKQQLFPGKHQG